MYTDTSISQCLLAVYMARLYWRVKKDDGKWTWRPVSVDGSHKEFWKIMDSLGLTLWDVETMWRKEE
jgi:hypothetical protein